MRGEGGRREEGGRATPALPPTLGRGAGQKWWYNEGRILSYCRQVALLYASTNLFLAIVTLGECGKIVSAGKLSARWRRARSEAPAGSVSAGGSARLPARARHHAARRGGVGGGGWGVWGGDWRPPLHSPPPLNPSPPLSAPPPPTPPQPPSTEREHVEGGVGRD
jgi:hypothetical protein